MNTIKVEDGREIRMWTDGRRYVFQITPYIALYWDEAQNRWTDKIEGQTPLRAELEDILNLGKNIAKMAEIVSRNWENT